MMIYPYQWMGLARVYCWKYEARMLALVRVLMSSPRRWGKSLQQILYCRQLRMVYLRVECRLTRLVSSFSVTQASYHPK
ncbi:hypothetical protein F441_01616 [Phytophthora nicotianae CJ01A1]|uniref:Uncharacterized protein n=3 Tax=Phytophthora nicotianae TaxID=4792 RepID=W2XRM7_PHYNI|nr:hypothetical protein L917_01522 [Phytophthora nicotianae]ETO84446.1 hypothetical protein F444_01653 [Phytophthora nicotianae P1976]ETP25520.1 hypothetical protein F441_01616 [Phytophthora nicotianae CJ01A1]